MRRLQTVTYWPLLALVLVCAMLIMSAHAKPAKTDACADAMQKLCSDCQSVQERKKCLMGHPVELSEACQSQLQDSTVGRPSW